MAQTQTLPRDRSALPPLLDHVRTHLRRLPRQARSRAKVAALLAAAERLFVERGYDAVTADAIAAAAGVSTGTFYSYFGDKRDALLLLLAERIDDLLGMVPAPEATVLAEGPRAVIRAAVARAVARGSDPRLQQLRRIWFAAARRDPELAAYERLAAEHATAAIRAGLEQTARLGLAQPLDAEATAWAIWTLVDALTLRLALLGDAMPPAERMVEATTELICRAVLLPPEPPRRRAAVPID
jgi:AcrR family transcriptional regulator